MRSRKEAAAERKPVTLGVVDAEPVAPAVSELLGSLRYKADDPRAVAGLLLRQLAAVLDASPGNVGVARELRQLLTFLSVDGSSEPGEVDERRVQFLLSRLRSS